MAGIALFSFLFSDDDVGVAGYFGIVTTTIDVTSDISTNNSFLGNTVRSSQRLEADFGRCTDINAGVTYHLGSITTTEYIADNTHITVNVWIEHHLTSSVTCIVFINKPSWFASVADWVVGITLVIINRLIKRHLVDVHRWVTYHYGSCTESTAKDVADTGEAVHVDSW